MYKLRKVTNNGDKKKGYRYQVLNRNGVRLFKTKLKADAYVRRLKKAHEKASEKMAKKMLIYNAQNIADFVKEHGRLPKKLKSGGSMYEYQLAGYLSSIKKMFAGSKLPSYLAKYKFLR